MLTTDLTLDEANAALEARLRLLKSEKTPEILELLAQDVNDILFNAIALFPTEANAVRIDATVKPLDDESGLPRGGTTYSGRTLLQSYLKTAGRAGLEERMDVRLLKHLPHTPRTGTFSRAKRAAGEGNETVRLEVADGEDPVAYASIDTLYSQGQHEYAHVLVNEIAAIELVKAENSQFSQVYKDAAKREVIAAPGAAYHYLLFRGFRDFSPESLGTPSKKWTQELATLARSMWVPERSTGLFHVLEYKDGYGKLEKTTFAGFAALATNPRDVILYHFGETPFAKDLLTGYLADVAQATNLVHGYRRDPSNYGATWALSGDDIIRRLAEYPILVAQAPTQ